MKEAFGWCYFVHSVTAANSFDSLFILFLIFRKRQYRMNVNVEILCDSHYCEPGKFNIIKNFASLDWPVLNMHILGSLILSSQFNTNYKIY